MPFCCQAKKVALEPSPGASIDNKANYRSYEAVKHLWELNSVKFFVESSGKLQNANKSSNSSSKGDDDIQNALDTLMNLSSTSFTLKK